ncbi:FAD-dependent oxidoreductase [Streptomyces sp. NPDC021212]|uniref:FAD-dependent oxidoreductase n=1 Tax=Streptomyces sp. NPDC021212 TaxID=3365118 RepID=UPI00378E121B
MSGTSTRYDAVVCGAGAGGLASAHALGALGLRVLLVDKQPRLRPVAKGEVLQPGALRVLRRWGTERLLEQRAGVRLGHLVVRDPAGTPLMALDYGQLPEGDRWLLSHDHLTILDALAEGLGPTVEVRRGALVEEALRDGPGGRVSGVAVTEGGRRYEVRAPLTVAADGISSRLRRAAGIGARRVDYPHRLVSFDLAGAPRPDDFSAYLSPRGLRLVYALPGDRVRLYVQTAPDELRGARDRAALAAWAEGVVAEVPALEPLAGPLLAGLDSRQMLPVSRFLSPRLAVPGMAFVGEAAYAVHPMAAQGMNTAITCAASLADQLADHLDGLPPSPTTVDAALRAYQAERRPILAQAATTSDNAARMVTDLTWRGRVVGRRAVRFTGRNPRLLHTVTYNMSGLGPRPMTFLDRLHQLGVLPDPRAHRVPQT